jgi:hypothetical protein
MASFGARRESVRGEVRAQPVGIDDGHQPFRSDILPSVGERSCDISGALVMADETTYLEQVRMT